MPQQAVITGDIVNSTLLPTALAKKLLRILTGIYESRTDCKLEFFRGDSFQAYVKDPSDALSLALLSRIAAIGIAKKAEQTADVRLSIGIGEVVTPVRELRTARGSAFILSGRQFDEINKSGKRLGIAIENPLANEGLQVIAEYINAIFENMSAKQAEVISELLKGEQQKMVARKLKKSKSTIHQRIVSGRWQEIEMLITRYRNIVNLVL